MSRHRPPWSRINSRTRWLIWLAALVLWTGAVLAPTSPNPDWGMPGLHEGWRFFLGKCLHFAAYAFLAALTVWLRAPRNVRFGLLLLLAAHAGITEGVQYFLVPGRSGTFRDVLINLAGLTTGFVLARTWRREREGAVEN